MQQRKRSRIDSSAAPAAADTKRKEPESGRDAQPDRDPAPQPAGPVSISSGMDAIDVVPLPQRERRQRRPRRRPAAGADANADPMQIEDDTPPAMERNFEYRDHTADIQILSWGETLGEAFAQSVHGMFGYMTDLSRVGVDPAMTREVSAEGHDLQSLLFNWLDECLFQFSAELFTIKCIKVLSFDKANFKIRARLWGEKFSLDTHSQGTEVKAITYSNMQIHDRAGQEGERCEVYVIVDI